MSENTTEQCSKAALQEDLTLEHLLCQSARNQRQAVERRAYQIFPEHGGTQCHDLDAWLEAAAAVRSLCF